MQKLTDDVWIKRGTRVQWAGIQSAGPHYTLLMKIAGGEKVTVASAARCQELIPMLRRLGATMGLRRLSDACYTHLETSITLIRIVLDSTLGDYSVEAQIPEEGAIQLWPDLLDRAAAIALMEEAAAPLPQGVAAA